ncbi:unnamed protein product [Didymodactylos carnosus]|uniref:HAT C-terminal dimerisation domain-containing protein n=1 Tax=Didymodactylos carnosus TaxID=1234261 RepID=A0A815DWV8_9BILA|nr:unnamed protein product [Didymodactylos carnosus]CAF4131550.1 unnamed protein product [Didymodactylos carnosus]
MVNALKINDEARYACFAHRTSTVLEIAWENVKNLYEAYDTLFQFLRERGEQHRLTHIDQKITDEISELMGEFSAIFDNLEFSKKPTLQNVIPSYYLMKQYCIVDNKRKNSIINQLKSEINKQLDDKYWTSTTSLHWIATYLDPSFKELSFVNDRKFLDDQKECIIDGLLVLTEDFKDFLTPTTTTDSSPSSSLSSTATTVATTTFTPPLKKIKKDDSFTSMRTNRSGGSSTQPQVSFQDEIKKQIQLYENSATYSSSQDNNPLVFWREQQQILTILAKIAKSIYVIQASSAESERHFSTSGQIVLNNDHN